MKRFPSLAAIALMGLIVGCGNDTPTGPASNTVLKLTLSGVQPLTNGLHFEGWAVIGGSAVSTGKFNINSSGSLVEHPGGAVIAGGEFSTGTYLGSATAIVLTIEPNGDTDTVAAATHYLAGSVSSNASSLSIGHASALGNSFSTAAGQYILATPTDGAGTNENSGIWFLDPTAGPGQGLQLPTLPAGWVYEGWTVINGIPVTTGTFTDPNAADVSAPYSGTIASGPPFPGEDFLSNAPTGLSFPTDISGGTAVISIEPSPDDSPLPFTLKPLTSAIPNPAVDHTSYSMTNQSGTFPSGSATIQ